MSSIYRELVERIRGELLDLESVVERTQRSWAHVQEVTSEQDIYLDSVALNLHGFYSGLERLFELIARHVDRSVPGGHTWHRDLLHRMSEEEKGVRPAVISHDTASSLDEFRRFRHLVRNVYTTNLEPERIVGLMRSLPRLWENLKAELGAFADFLEELDRS